MIRKESKISKQKEENKIGEEILKSDSSISGENEIKSYPTKLTIPKSPTDIIIKTDNNKELYLKQI